MSNCTSPEYWNGCYTGNYGLISEESVSHPAKMSPALCFRIFEHLKELGLLKEGDTVLDPMAGTGMTGLVTATLGYKAVLVELEPYFKDLIGDCDCQGVTEQLCRRMLKGTNRTRKLSYINTRVCPACQGEVDNRRRKDGKRTIFQSKPHRYEGNIGKLRQKFPKADITVLQGDSRQLSTLLAQRGLIACTSPPYGEAMQSEKSGIDWTITRRENGRLRDMTKEAGHANRPGGGTPMQYSDNLLNIGNLRDRPIVITSPPFLEAQTGGGIAKQGYRGPHIDEMGKNQPDKVGDRCGYTEGKQGQSDGQIANLPDKPICVTSPPYEDSDTKKDADWWRNHMIESGRNPDSAGARQSYMERPNSDGQLGNLKEQSYQKAMLLVYSEIAKVASVLVVVTKNPTRNGKLRRLDLDTQAMMEDAGWSIICHHKARLFEEHSQTDMFGNVKKKVKGRLGFFKRLSWQKGSEVAQWEDVFVAINGKDGLKVVCSPPYEDSLESGSRHGNSGIAKRDPKYGNMGRYGSSSPGQIGGLRSADRRLSS